jgi:hypothetical protein
MLQVSSTEYVEKNIKNILLISAILACSAVKYGKAEFLLQIYHSHTNN